MFNYSSEPSLRHTASAIVQLFFHLNVKRLDVRRVAKLFGQGKTKYKTMLRKLYAVVAALEIAGIVSRTETVSEIQLNAPLQAPLKTGQFTLLSVLNSPEDAVRQRKYEARQKEFERISSEDARQPAVARFDADAAAPPASSTQQRISGFVL
jgi:hypothetical protein